MNKIIPSSLAAILLALSATSALADAGDKNFPDNPILAEHYYYAHRADAAPVTHVARAETPRAAHSTGHETPRFVSLPRTY